LIVSVSDLLRRAGPEDSARILARRDALMSPFASHDAVIFDQSILRGEIAPPGSDLQWVAERVVEYSYAVHFQGALVDVPYHAPATAPTTRVLAAVQRFDGRDILVGTIRVAWNDRLEVFELFDVAAPALWPHVALGQPFGELHKMAMHPIVDALANAAEPEVRAHGRRYRVAVWNTLRGLFEKLLVERGRFHVYYIASERVRRFLVGADYVATRLDTALPARTESSRRLREEWRRYFRPDEPAELQPHVFYRSTR
jgi:hypothetical protein